MAVRQAPQEEQADDKGQGHRVPGRVVRERIVGRRRDLVQTQQFAFDGSGAEAEAAVAGEGSRPLSADGAHS